MRFWSASPDLRDAFLAFLSQCRSQNGYKICQKSNKNQKNTDYKNNFEIDTISCSIFDQILINFEAKITPHFDPI